MSSKFKLYNARGNKYFVATPYQIRKFLGAFPTTADAAASLFHDNSWASKLVDLVCLDQRAATQVNRTGGKEYLSNGLLIGPFRSGADLGMLIVNTNGDLAELSGNGLTIFSQFLVDKRKVDKRKKDGSAKFLVRVYHNQSEPIEVQIEPTTLEGKRGFWINMPIPAYGPEAVQASLDCVAISELNGRDISRVLALETIDATWTHSQFVKVGNPHCVTFLESKESLSFADNDSSVLEEKGESDLCKSLKDIAYNSLVGDYLGKGEPCEPGINLQWAVPEGPDRIHARVFERGERWTKSSGSSATAVACAARHLGLVTEAIVIVEMSGGPLPVRFDERDGHVERVLYFGEAQECFV